jgi:putative sterol carrier protein
MNLLKYTCPCCGYKTFNREDHLWEICEVCFWESCPIQNVEPLYLGGPNHISLAEAQQNFITFGACEECSLPSVRKPREDEPKDENWKPFSTNKYPKIKFTSNWKQDWQTITTEQYGVVAKEKGFCVNATSERFWLELQYNRNPDKAVLWVKEGQVSLLRQETTDITEIIDVTNIWIEIIDKKIITIQENKTDEINHIEKHFPMRVTYENQLFEGLLTVWMNYDLGIEKIRKVMFKYNNKTILIDNTYEDYERMLFDLQITLPQKYKIETCFFCRFSCYHPVGNDNFGALDCFKNCKEKMVKVEEKHGLLDLYREEEANIQKVEETSYCAEFQSIEKDNWVYKRQVE